MGFSLEEKNLLEKLSVGFENIVTARGSWILLGMTVYGLQKLSVSFCGK